MIGGKRSEQESETEEGCLGSLVSTKGRQTRSVCTKFEPLEIDHYASEGKNRQVSLWIKGKIN